MPVRAFFCLITAYSCANEANFISKETEHSTANANAGAEADPESDDALPANPSDSDPNANIEEKADDSTKDQEGFRLVRDFKTTFEENAAFKFKPRERIVEQEFTLTSSYDQVEKKFTQISRPNVTKNFRQGNPGEMRSEKLFQGDQGILDLLIVIDDSGSMVQEQTNLSTKLAPLLEYIKDSDWRIGVVTTDQAKGCSRKVIQKGDTDIEAAFANAINAGLAGSGNEQGIKQAVAGLSCITAPFVRSTSTVAVLIVSDEDNCSDGKGCSAPYDSSAYLTDFLTTTMKRKLGTDARVYGIFWEPATTCQGAATIATQYAKAVADSSGTSGSICDADYTKTLGKISENVAAILKADFKLKATPDKNSFALAVNGVKKTTGFEIIGDVLRFAELPPKGATIDVNYTIGASPYENRYPLGEKPGPGTLSVRFDGQPVSADGYDVEDETNILVFKTMPPTSAAIKIDFLQNLPLTKSFDLAATVKPGSVKVKVNGQASMAFAVTSGKIIMNMAPADGAAIVATFDKLIGPDLKYKIPFAGTDLRDVDAVAKQTNSPVPITLKDDFVWVDQASHVEGAVVVLRYFNSDSSKMEIKLPHQPIMQSVNVVGLETDCSLGEGFEIDGDLMKIDCDLINQQEVDVTFKYKKDPINTFPVHELMGLIEFNIEVFINGKVVKDFLVNKPVVRITEKVPFDSTVKIIVTAKK